MVLVAWVGVMCVCVCVCVVRKVGCVGWLNFRVELKKKDWDRFAEGRWCGESAKPGS